MVLVHVCIIDHFLTLKAFIVLNEKQAIAFIFHVYYVHKVKAFEKEFSISHFSKSLTTLDPS